MKNTNQPVLKDIDDFKQLILKKINKGEFSNEDIQRLKPIVLSNIDYIKRLFLNKIDNEISNEKDIGDIDDFEQFILDRIDDDSFSNKKISKQYLDKLISNYCIKTLEICDIEEYEDDYEDEDGFVEYYLNSSDDESQLEENCNYIKENCDDKDDYEDGFAESHFFSLEDESELKENCEKSTQKKLFKKDYRELPVRNYIYIIKLKNRIFKIIYFNQEITYKHFNIHEIAENENNKNIKKYKKIISKILSNQMLLTLEELKFYNIFSYVLDKFNFHFEHMNTIHPFDRRSSSSMNIFYFNPYRLQDNIVSFSVKDHFLDNIILHYKEIGKTVKITVTILPDSNVYETKVEEINLVDTIIQNPNFLKELDK